MAKKFFSKRLIAAILVLVMMANQSFFGASAAASNEAHELVRNYTDTYYKQDGTVGTAEDWEIHLSKTAAVTDQDNLFDITLKIETKDLSMQLAGITNGAAVLVLDVSSPYVHSHWETTLAVLEELGASDKELVAVFNKADLLGGDVVALAKVRALAPEGILLSCTEKTNFDLLCQKLSLLARRKNQRMELCIPPDKQELIAFLHAKGKIHESRWEEDGAFYAVADLSPVIRHKFEPYAVRKHS